jgi:hypothetical protein
MPRTVLPLHGSDYETSESDPKSKNIIHPAKVHPTSIVKLALNRLIMAVFMILSPPCVIALSITGLANNSVTSVCKMQITGQVPSAL